MAGFQPLIQNAAIVKPDGTPTDYFIKWAQNRQRDIGTALTLADLIEILGGIQIDAGAGLDGGGALAPDETIEIGLADIPGVAGSYTNTNLTVNAKGQITAAANGSGGGGNWWFNPPSVASFTAFSASTLPTIAFDADAGLQIESPGAINSLTGGYRTLTNKALDWTVEARISMFSLLNTTAAGAGLFLQDSITGRVVLFGYIGSLGMCVDQWGSLVGFSSRPLAAQIFNNDLSVWFRIRSTGGTLSMQSSADGKRWLQVYSQGATSYLTNRADRVGLNVASFNVARTAIACEYFSLTGPAV